MTIYAIIITIIAATLFVGWWHERKAKLEAVDTLRDLSRYIRQRCERDNLMVTEVGFADLDGRLFTKVSLGEPGKNGGGKGGDARVTGTGTAIGGKGGDVV